MASTPGRSGARVTSLSISPGGVVHEPLHGVDQAGQHLAAARRQCGQLRHPWRRPGVEVAVARTSARSRVPAGPNSMLATTAPFLALNLLASGPPVAACISSLVLAFAVKAPAAAAGWRLQPFGDLDQVGALLDGALSRLVFGIDGAQSCFAARPRCRCAPPSQRRQPFGLRHGAEVVAQLSDEVLVQQRVELAARRHTRSGVAERASHRPLVG